ncbi:MAG: hypothetical protein COU07_00900 [Candidatus Harrisonbacteria bacterium CG10_big_fil_rev_8_21_14_0_10_40_38]|uniref:PEGA domain-containing protein n=1 Tax=Candidatus Harrisonbacteria bacterium CG10_big_fil_rev_8_21_14_0_10_40_38 TaxID=1974583 RepID=A0A2H0USQ3_9BACT|nr:MAG: hypothetical protein COU07_00900 [Candidatus Harrisonbacteria bacterium CG10_big_fil_rev_8_21_14_0_10_40_38]
MRKHAVLPLLEKKRLKGLSLLETVIGVALLVVIGLVLYQGFSVVLTLLTSSRQKVAAASIANEQIEVLRNMPYSDVGVVGGVPSGVVPPVQIFYRDNYAFTLTTTIRNVDDPFDGTIGGAPNDTSPADYKLVSLELNCANCDRPEIFNFTGRVAPRSLESTGSNGAIFIQAIDANGIGIPSAKVHVVNASSTPQIDLTDETDSDGYLKLIDVPPGSQTYDITVSKTGYSTDQTYEPSVSVPNPVKLPVTVATGQVTSVTFAIDRVSTLGVSSLTESCSPVGSINFTLSGAKLIGTTPDILKYSNGFTTGSGGTRTVSNLEWDAYSMSFSNSSYDVAGTIPNIPLNLLPNSTQDFKIVVQPKDPQALLVTVKDSVTLLPIANTVVNLTKSGYDETITTGRGSFNQTDWSGGSGQADFGDLTGYESQDGNISVDNPVGDLTLNQVSTTTYVSSGFLTSSTFDTGSDSTFYTISYNPTNQSPDTGSDPLKIQIATATTSSPLSWDFLGPDGTSNTFYTTTSPDINTDHNGDRYFKYKIYLSTASTSFTPNVSDVTLTYASECVPPGQAFFHGLSSGSYTLDVSHSGYDSYSQTITVGSSWEEIEVFLDPSS